MNHLANETSPYLLQHANNPVNWYPWGDEAITKARTENKPILLSIGYSACHWCHVMAHESFEDEGTAELMNKLFVNIKVDREERPDLDKVYQTAHYLLTRHQGGWPLTVFLTPDDLTPFFAGTYFPRNTRYGMLPFVEVLLRIADAYQTQHTEIQEQNKLLQQALTNMAAQFTTENCQISAIPLQKSIDEITQLFDAENGGFSTAPKFPHTDMVDSLLRISSLNVDKKALNMAFFTLEKMALGGIYDQLAGGFSRYSVDEFWMIPHFEKMLYDNALLLNVYVDAAKLSKNPLFVKIAEQTANWIIKKMQSAEGGYYSAIDADSEDKEGKFYVWDKEEVAAHLTPEEFAVIERYYNLQKPANFEGKWHLYVSNDLPTVAKELNISVAKAQLIIETANNKLLKIREKRVPPARDEKILTSWNALIIKSMAKAGKYLQKPELIISARKALHFIREKMWREKRLLATYKDKRAHLNAYLDDYAFLLEALLILLEVEWCSQDLQFAIEIADVMLAKFFDEKEGGFFFTSHDHEQLLQRLKLWNDEALPAGNGVAAFALGRFGYLLGEQRYLVAAEKTLQAGWNFLIQASYAHNSLLKALEDYIKPPRIIILRGEKQLMQDWLQDYEHHYQSQQIFVAIPANEQQLPAALQQYKKIDEITAYSCENFQCAAPITKKEDFIKVMKVD